MKLQISSPWPRFLLVKALEWTSAVVALVVLTFAVVQLVPGDPARVIAGQDASPAVVEATRAQLGLDRPMLEQFRDYVLGVLRGDLGESFRTGDAVSHVIAVRLPYTATIALAAMALTLVISLTLGFTVAGLTRGNRNRWLDSAFSWATAGLQALPHYVVGTLLVVLFAVTLGLLPAAGTTGPRSYILPSVALSLGPICAVSRVVRREASAVLEQDYMRTARGWRIGVVKQYAKYAMPNLLASTLTLSGLILAGMLGGAIIVERVFAWPGLGNAVIEAILNRDYAVTRGSSSPSGSWP
ncbi:ABC transporter permease [Phycicoccus endophyticus]|uniref:ABC transporter permease n=1 Tax=Phycicoccus endophyticus TaxID=1690220 RepID=UPI001CB729FA|nr:ABC transporter permease [Phycicoccus endophyticus]